MREHDRALFISAKPQDRLERFVLTHIRQERLPDRTVIIERRAVALAGDGLATERCPLFHGHITVVTGTKQRPSPTLELESSGNTC
jgi:hypothetical protein